MRRVLRITLILIIPSFVFYYGWSASRKSQTEKDRYFARIKEGALQGWHQIDEADLQDAQLRLLQRFASFAGLLGIPQRFFMNPRVRESIPPLAQIKEAVNYYVLLKEGYEHGLYSTSDEIINQFKAQWPENTAAYLKQYMRNRDIYNEAQLIQEERKDSIVNKSKYLFYAEARASLFELWQQFQVTEENLKIDYVKIPVSTLEEEIEPSGEALQTYFEEHEEEYRVPEQYVYKYVNYSIEDMGTTVTVSEQGIEEYYEQNREQFKVPKRVKARRIVFNVPPDSSPEIVEQKNKQAQEIYERLSEGESFAQLANQYSDEYKTDGATTPTKKGGELPGWVTPYSERMYGKTFVNNTLSLEVPGEITEPFQTQQGFVIVKADEIEPEKYRPLEEVESTIRSTIFEQKAKQIVDSRASKLSLDLYKYTSINALASELGLPVERTEPTEAGQYFFPDIGGVREFKSAFNQMKNSRQIEIFPLIEKMVLMQLDDVIESHIPDFADVRDQVEQDYVREQAQEKARQMALKIEGEVTDADTLRQAAEERDLAMETTDYFTRSELPPELGTIPEFHRFTLETSVGEVLVSESKDSNDTVQAYIVWLLKDKKEPSLDSFKQALPRLERELLQIKRETLLHEFLADARQNLKLDINPQFINR